MSLETIDIFIVRIDIKYQILTVNEMDNQNLERSSEVKSTEMVHFSY